MPTEVTIEGAQRITGLSKVVPVKTEPRNSAEEVSKIRQELPPKLQSVAVSETRDRPESSSQNIVQEIEGLNSKVQNLRRDLHFSVDAESGRTIIRVIDSETKETIRTIPPEDISVIAERLEQHSGVLFNTSV